MSTQAPESSFTSTLQTASQSWTTFSLESKRPSLQQNATQTKSNHQQSQKSRKTLAETTKAFKKTVKQTESILLKSGAGEKDKFSSECKTVVKAYQEEIDNLTKRCKASDTMFMDLYKGLVELTDPAPLLTNAVDHLHSLEGQVQHLLKGMEEMQMDFERNDSMSKSQIEELERELSILNETNENLKTQLEKIEAQLIENAQNNQIAKQEQSYLSKEEKEELIALRSEVAEYELEFKTLKNQDITIKKLNAKIEDLVASQEDDLQRELKKAQEHLAQTEGRRATEALEREATMARQLASLELELKAERAGSQVAQTHLLEADQGQNEREAVWEAQRQILVDDSDRLREVLHEVTRERNSLKMRVEALSGKDDNDDGRSTSGNGNGGNGISSMVDVMAERKAYEAEVGELTLTVTAMREELRTKDETVFKLQSSMQSTIESLEGERGYLSNQVAELERKIADAPSKEMVDNMRRELRILKKLEYNAVEIDNEKEEPELTPGPTNDNNGDDDLESVLIGKLRKLEADLVKERREKSDHLEEYQKLKEELVDLEQAKADSDRLVSRLESDLEKAITAPSASTTNVKSNSEMLLNTNSDPSTLQHILDPSSPAPPKSTAYKAQSNSAVEKINEDHSVATIVMAQRDRLRARCDAIEAERDGFKRELQVQVSTSESLRTDNTKLYEKVRYLQNYSNSSSVAMRARNNGTDRDMDLEALEQRYEASVDPFRQFSRNEKQRKLKEMSPVEKTVFVVARTVLGSKEMRTALFFYVSTLHLLVFATTYHWSHGCHAVPLYSAIDELHAGIPNVVDSPP